MPKQIHLAAHFPGVNNTTVWSDPNAGSQIDIASFVHLARTAERGRFDFFFLAEGLRLRERKGLIHDLDVVGRPESLTVLAALAGATERLGLAATVNSTFNEPYELARRLATLDHLSDGRAAWNVVTSWDAFTGENFRRGGYLDEADRYARARETLQTARELWDSWTDDAIVADRESGEFVRPGQGEFRHRGEQFDISGLFSTPRGPQGHPVIIQAGDSEEGREFAASDADVIFSRHSRLEEARTFYKDVKSRLAKYGRAEDDLKILPAVTFVLGATEEEAAERAAAIRTAQVSPQTALAFLESVWGRDLSDHDPDGPLPAADPDPDEKLAKGWARFNTDRAALARQWRKVAEEKNLTTRELVIEVTSRQTFVGTPAAVAAQLDEFVQTGGSDGFILAPHLTPGGLDDFVDEVVPLLQERGVFRTEYTGPTLRDHLGLAAPRFPRKDA
ncbi:NtaA/DmoA family FMN-dependent monooxygenase [Actinomadura parmotrematis]|uniref:NtaA/DmoA family FMN-dependent monooxygenase n=1 Tax=Actinomadura parmotrematis TaxID=2864039 RepID=A0ABS7G2M6_9ACTN|nr:NtaA/DmoA family FMN-dependent monooxygenase [Actinomadura parmotrematis]MBW8486781.1 NtaA/DmoA family FMN-dependent monooxygenase [Actinomadura parmotrematis]